MTDSIGNYSDNEIVKLFIETEDTQYFSEIYSRYKDKVYSKNYYFTKTTSDADDITQDIFIKLYFVLPQFSFKSSFSTWLYRLVHNHCLNWIKKNRKDEYLEFDENIAYDDSPHDRLIQEFNHEELDSILMQMNPHESSILLLRYYDNFSIQEISEIIEITQSATKMRLARARQSFIYFYKVKVT